ncbi:MAG: Uma2 family endonuclease [bacterium]
MAISLRLPTQLTDEEIMDLSARNPGLQIEQAPSGELILTPPASPDTGWREVKLLAQLDRWATEQGQGIVFSPSSGFRLPDGSLRCPDASWVRRERWSALTPAQRKGFGPMCPDAVFEIRSHSDSLSDLREKMRMYLANGAQLGVLIDPQSRMVDVYEAGREPRVQEQAESMPLAPVLPGFVLDLKPIFQYVE